MSSPSSRPPAGIPRSGSNTIYAIIAGLLFGAVGVFLALRGCAAPSSPAPVASGTTATSVEPPPNPKLDDIPLPAPVVEETEAGQSAPRIATAPTAGCDGKCSGSAPPELEQALAVRGQQARRCYNQALAQDSSLKGHVNIAVRIGPAGNLCSATVASNDMGSPNVANCAANIFRANGSWPAPHGGCINANVPLSFVATGH